MAIGEICRRQVVVARGGETVQEAARLMRRHHVGSIVVVDERDGVRVPVGIITDRDIVVGVVAKEVEPGAVTLAEVVARNLATLPESAGVAEAVELMRSRGVRRLPVVGRDGALLGIVTVDDLVDLLAEELGGLARLVSREQARETALRSP